MNRFGGKFGLSIFGESHGESLGAVVDGIPAGMELGTEDLMDDVRRRKSGAHGTTARIESDTPAIVSGLYNGYTTGAPLCILFRNQDTRPKDYDQLKDHPRPSHADHAASVKFCGYNDHRGGGHLSGRLTLPLVAAGAVAKKILGKNVVISARTIEIGGCTDPQQFEDILESARTHGDSVGGIIECTVDGLPAGMGEPFFDSVESIIAHLLFSIPAVKGVEFGNGFASARLTGSRNNDPIISSDGSTSTNNSGGVNGGITNGNQLIIRMAIKPTSSISSPQATFNFRTGSIEELRLDGRHDTCIALRIPVVMEAAVAIGLVQLAL